jgi:NAD(P)-dependent dehydrogenase (short-subunit alcohol dehydrogenase family)
VNGIPEDDRFGAVGGAPVHRVDLPRDLAGRRAVVTAGARGIGEEIAKSLIEAGAKVTVVDKDERTLHKAFPTQACNLVPADLSGDNTAVAAGLLEDGPIELIVNNVGVNTERDFLDLRPQDFDQVMATNLRGPLFFTQSLVRALVEAQASETGGRPRRGSIVFISSLHESFHGDDLHYSLSKNGVVTLARNLAKQLARYRIRVNSISPGWIPTAPDPTTPDQVAKRQFLLPRVPAGRPGRPDDVARLAIVLLSDAWSDYITGQHIAVNGGLSLFNTFRDEDGPRPGGRADEQAHLDGQDHPGVGQEPDVGRPGRHVRQPEHP